MIKSVRALVVTGFAILGGCLSATAGGQDGEATGVGQWLVAPQVYDPPESYRGRSVILLHGLGGSPYDVKPLAESLRQSGFRLVVPVLPGETKRSSKQERAELSADDMVDWLERLVEEEEKLFGRPPFVVGFSMGGTLATIEAERARIGRLVLVSPFYSLAWGDEFLTKTGRYLSPVIPAVPKPWKGKVNDPAGYDRYQPGTPFIPLPSFLRLQELARRARKSAQQLPPVPTLVLASPDDEVASFSVTRRLFSSRPETQLKSFPGSNHILLYDYAHREVIEAAREFLEMDDGPVSR